MAVNIMQPQVQQEPPKEDKLRNVLGILDTAGNVAQTVSKIKAPVEQPQAAPPPPQPQAPAPQVGGMAPMLRRFNTMKPQGGY